MVSVSADKKIAIPGDYRFEVVKLAQKSSELNLCHSFQAFNTCYADTGLWGLYFTTDKMKIDDFMNSKLFNCKYQFSLIFKYFI
jgi:hypothetical protein